MKVAYRLCFFTLQVAKRQKSLRLIPLPSPLNKLGFNHKIERFLGT